MRRKKVNNLIWSSLRIRVRRLARLDTSRQLVNMAYDLTTRLDKPEAVLFWIDTRLRLLRPSNHTVPRNDVVIESPSPDRIRV